MGIRELIGQLFGMIGLVIIVSSFQCKKNKTFFVMQGAGSMAFVLNFLLIGAYAGAMYNFVNLIRGLLFSKEDKKLWKLILVNFLYTASYGISLVLIRGDWFMVFISAIPFVALFIMSIFMWMNSGKYIRYFQMSVMSPSWIVYNCFNFSLGGILCESFNIISSIVSLVRFRKTGFEQDI